MQIYPAMKARMGDWDYYIVRMRMRDIAHEVQLASALWDDRTLSDAIQRVLDESRVKEGLVNFLARRDDRFFASLVVAAIGGSPSWTPIESRFRDSFGELAFEEDPKYYALDGQHRLRAIQELMADQSGAPPGFGDEQMSVIVVVREHQGVDDDLWLQRYRRLFSSLNRYARPTGADTNIIMDEDDIFAIVTRRLITDHEFFRAPDPERKSMRVQTKGKNLKSGTSHFTSLQALYEVNKTLLMTAERRRKWGRAKDMKIFLQFRPDEDEIDRYYLSLANHWDALLQAIAVLHEEPERMRVHDVPDPNTDGYRDHLLFWPIGQQLAAEIARSLLDCEGLFDNADVATMESAIRPLADVPWDLHGTPWRYLLLVPANPPQHDSWRMRSEDRKAALEVAAELLRWIVGLDPLNDAETQSLCERWRSLLYPEPPDDQETKQMWQEVVDARRRIHDGG